MMTTTLTTTDGVLQNYELNDNLDVYKILGISSKHDKDLVDRTLLYFEKTNREVNAYPVYPPIPVVTHDYPLGTPCSVKTEAICKA